jgi:hypothetical protein
LLALAYGRFSLRPRAIALSMSASVRGT